MTDWTNALREAAKRLAKGDEVLDEFVNANVASVEQLIRGIGPDDHQPSAGAGACIVFNMSSKHVPAFCNQSAAGDLQPYKNAYQLGKVGPKRALVDDAIVKACADRRVSVDKQKLCFGAVETSGTGIRFFGDMCLVLRYRPAWYSDGPVRAVPDSVEDQALHVLERNSYDLVRAPVVARLKLAERTGATLEDSRVEVIAAWLGSWEKDLIAMLALRIVQALPGAPRRWTTGEIAREVLDDEDYCEVLFPHSFSASALLEVRTSAAEAAAEGDIADRERTGEAPGLHELEWRQQRREARRSLARLAIPVRVITTSGRIKGS